MSMGRSRFSSRVFFLTKISPLDCSICGTVHFGISCSDHGTVSFPPFFASLLSLFCQVPMAIVNSRNSLHAKHTFRAFFFFSFQGPLSGKNQPEKIQEWYQCLLVSPSSFVISLPFFYLSLPPGNLCVYRFCQKKLAGSPPQLSSSPMVPLSQCALSLCTHIDSGMHTNLFLRSTSRDPPVPGSESFFFAPEFPLSPGFSYGYIFFSFPAFVGRLSAWRFVLFPSFCLISCLPLTSSCFPSDNIHTEILGRRPPPLVPFFFIYLPSFLCHHFYAPLPKPYLVCYVLRQFYFLFTGPPISCFFRKPFFVQLTYFSHLVG